MNITYYIKSNQARVFVLLAIVLVPVSIVWLAVANLYKWHRVDEGMKCEQEIALKLIENIPQTLKINPIQSTCVQFHANAGQALNLGTNTTISLIDPSNKSITLQGKSKDVLQKTGNYLLYFNSKRKDIDYSIEISLQNKFVEKKYSSNRINNRVQAYIQPNNTEYFQRATYNIVVPPKFNSSAKLQYIVDNAVKLVKLKGLPIEKLSISLIDLSGTDCCASASYLDNETRYPASVIKLFWMVELFSQFQAGIIPEETFLEEDIYKMIQDSSNESASRILDKISKTESGEALSKNKLDIWLAHRYSINQFFEQAGYQKINISQKPFPIPYLNLTHPEGRDLQIRQIYGRKAKPVRNYLTTYSVARLLFEIYKNQAITEQYSTKMKALLQRDLHPKAWKQKPYNSIAGFLGESLPVDTDFYSKMGWTFSNRNDAAIIATPDGKHRYILVLFGDDPSFYQNKKLFPEISRTIYNQITN